jgi:hypothetical protein
MSIIFLDKDRNVIDTLAWARLLEDSAYRIIQVDVDGDIPEESHLMVSTIWDGLDGLNLSSNPDDHSPFDTALLRDGLIIESHRTPTLEAALEVHTGLCFETFGRRPLPDGGLRQLILDREAKSREHGNG